MGLSNWDDKIKNLNKEQQELCKQIEASTIDSPCLMLDKDSAHEYMSLFSDAEKYELIWTRISGSQATIPDEFRFIGYDISYLPDEQGAFSIICDCMFICRWHGCDEAGTEFAAEYSKLNTNGLFSSFTDAYLYMVHYLSQDWSERGRYGIFEIYADEIGV